MSYWASKTPDVLSINSSLEEPNWEKDLTAQQQLSSLGVIFKLHLL